MGSNKELKEIAATEYQYGFETVIEQDTLPPGLDEGVITHISQMKGEPQWLLDWRLEAYRLWLTLEQPDWGHLNIAPVDYQAISYYSAPKTSAVAAIRSFAANTPSRSGARSSNSSTARPPFRV